MCSMVIVDFMLLSGLTGGGLGNIRRKKKRVSSVITLHFEMARQTVALSVTRLE